ncbi:hypothetical protein KZE55_02025 [Limosilactobacillus panis]|uniref:hypothetical protein n=1 Tax=Limosilactobacillus panis TaxID=47493 RepID=UPI001C9683B8|nr:hypothetical protein [Limosilactobacillus panis]QZN93368.1 hypothetical protein KZE55_02025 [Limosilactobacillus panis]
MKRLLSLIAVLLLGGALSACGNNSNQSKENSSLRAENSSLRAKNSSKTDENVNKYKDDEYALAAYLKLQNQTASDLEQDTANMNWQANGNSYTIGFGGHTTTMTVNKDSVDVTYDEVEGDHMGSGNGHKTYSKKQLNNSIKQQKSTIDQLLNNDNGSSSTKVNNSSANNQSSPAGNQQTQVSNTTSQTTTNQSDPNDVARAKGFKDVGGHSAAEWSQWEAGEEAVNSPENLARYQAEHGSN